MKNKYSSLSYRAQLGDLELYTAPDMAFERAFTVSPKIHSHPYYEVLISIEGRLTVKLLDNRAIELEQGSLCIIPPNCYHCTCADKEMPKKLGVRFSYAKAVGDARMYDRFSSAIESIVEPTCFKGSEKISDLVIRLRSEVQEKLPVWELECRSLLQLFYIEIFRLLTRDGANDTKYTFDDSKCSRSYRIDAWFAENMKEQIKKDDLASEMSLSTRQLCRVFSDIYGMSFREKLIELRLHRAAQLLEQTNQNAENIAVSVGYRSFSGFHRAFCKHFGCTPYEYRKNITNKGDRS